MSPTRPSASRSRRFAHVCSSASPSWPTSLATRRSATPLFDRRDLDGAAAIVEEAVKAEDPELSAHAARLSAAIVQLLTNDPGPADQFGPARERFAALSVRAVKRAAGLGAAVRPAALLDCDWDPVRERFDWVLEAAVEAVRVTVTNDGGRKKTAEACVGLAEVLIE